MCIDDRLDYVDYSEDIYVGYRYFETIPGACEKVVYPFGYGLSYTKFNIEPLCADAIDGVVQVSVRVKNEGNYPGKEVVQLYYRAPRGLLGKPVKVLGAFAKTRLLAPGESQDITLDVRIDNMASFDDTGKVAKSAYVLEKGDYLFFVGNNVRDAKQLDFVYTNKDNKITQQLSSQLAPSQLKERLVCDGTYETLPAGKPFDTEENGLSGEEPVAGVCMAPAVRFVPPVNFFEMPDNIPFDDVADGKASLEQFMSQLSIDEKIHLLGGQPNTGAANTFGFGNLPEFNVPSVMTADGPAGLRIRPECGVFTTSFPCATQLASTWDSELVEKVGFAAGEEVKENNISVWLTPAVNIHRSPLCGRNFEYYSEDPMLAGVLSGAMIKGIQANKVAAEIKHFCCNNKETNRR